MKPRLLTILLLLLAGVVVNVAVAWGCALWAPFHFGTRGSHVSPPILLPWEWSSDAWHATYSNVGLDTIQSFEHEPDGRWRSQWVLRSGAPMRALQLIRRDGDIYHVPSKVNDALPEPDASP